MVTVLGGLVLVIDKAKAAHSYIRDRTGKKDELLRTRRDYLVGAVLAVACALLWSASYVSLSAVSRTTGVLAINVVLMGTATVFLYVASVVARWFEKRSGTPASSVMPWQSGRAQTLILANLGNFVLSILALRYISASQATALNNMSPGFLALALLLGGRLSGSISTGVTFALVLLGVWIMNSDESFVFRPGPDLTGSAIAIAAGVSFAVWAYVMDRVEDNLMSTSARLRLLAMVFFGSYAILLTTGWLSGEVAPSGRFEVVVLAFNGLRVALVYFLFQLAIKRAGPLLPSVLVVSQVPLTMVWDHFWLSTQITFQLVLGSTLLILGIVALLSDELRRSAEAGSGRPATAV